MTLPFRLRWAAFWCGFTHPFPTDQERVEAVERLYKKYRHLLEKQPHA